MVRWQFRATTALVVTSFFCSSGSFAQGMLRERLKQRFGGQSQAADGGDTANLSSAKTNEDASGSPEKINLAGLKVAVWEPTSTGKPMPLIIFSHGFCGVNTQSKFLMKALASAGYLVMAPNHHDAMFGAGLRPETGFAKAAAWNDQTYRDRGDDITALVQALHSDPQWNQKIDWSKFALAGHSLGGYTALALAGAWPSWKLPHVKAVLALSPYSEPFVAHGTLKDLHVPVMYQGGTKDYGITPFLKRPNGAFDQTSSPAYFVEFDNVGHLAFSDMNKNPSTEALICQYSLAFLNRYVLEDPTTPLEVKQPGVTILETK